ncbi:MAG: OmpH family outer membrane protein [Bacteroidales bacterium]|jgi:outer membrane protein|nr:OmpH family outer membrane protein [Bacteroidales bacterium]MBQ1841696.1 OmpH family outer membrane protein [Bacteroidales bacterium]MBQ2549971.1 OmpH family outer membrane protein [Bacteroidales bacterium]
MKKIFIIAAMALMTLSASAQKIGRVNFSELVQLMPEADEARATLQAISKEADETLQSMYEEYQTKMNQYQQKQATWTPAIKESKEKELMEIQNRLQESQQTFQQEIQQKQNELMAPIYEKAQNTIKELAKGQALTAVFDASSALYFDEATTVDLTPAARKALNIAEGRTLQSLQEEIQAQAASQQQ